MLVGQVGATIIGPSPIGGIGTGSMRAGMVAWDANGLAAAARPEAISALGWLGTEASEKVVRAEPSRAIAELMRAKRCFEVKEVCFCIRFNFLASFACRAGLLRWVWVSASFKLANTDPVG